LADAAALSAAGRARAGGRCRARRAGVPMHAGGGRTARWRVAPSCCRRSSQAAPPAWPLK